MNILITGGSGFLGRALTDFLLANSVILPSTVSHETSTSQLSTPEKNAPIINITWVSRKKTTPHPQSVEVLTYEELKNTDTYFEIIINLAGAGIADKRWSAKRKQYLYDSRLQPTQALLDYIDNTSTKPRLLISGSAIGWYGVQKDSNQALTEDSNCVSTDFAHQLCDDWEKLALTAVDKQVPTAIIRTGVVLHPNGGMIGRLKTPFSLGLGGRLGDGKQVLSWISREDWVRAVVFIINHQLSLTVADTQIKTVYNLTAPQAVTNASFTKSVGKWLARPTFSAQPRSVVTMIFGEMATLLIDGQSVYPKQLLDLGFTFKHHQVIQALQLHDNEAG